MTVRASYLDILESLDTDALLPSFTRLRSHRGTPHVILCDNGTNFKEEKLSWRKPLRRWPPACKNGWLSTRFVLSSTLLSHPTLTGTGSERSGLSRMPSIPSLGSRQSPLLFCTPCLSKWKDWWTPSPWGMCLSMSQILTQSLPLYYSWGGEIMHHHK